ncbi:uncharacterized protein MONBRDRAFT_11698 [Monosiga brevicollis MX1]|uniref:SH2 domain-containing protein n=1 Tax=Monosiga brevicollis TaxID=81824 RepID=A9VA09_MONBE|nr:uncharacterized protein MONBRDRAFT_11698 [Monosiga brevicollis MX1]EDQ85581.1 predicted protein [Monosiga brevicollis MX1]|eukprot:XP_001749530.1 hypothetical protein [Monosiga brevicollis MX1]
MNSQIGAVARAMSSAAPASESKQRRNPRPEHKPIRPPGRNLPPTIGVTLTRDSDQPYGLILATSSSSHGLFVAGAKSHSPASRAPRLEPGQRIITVNGEKALRWSRDVFRAKIQHQNELHLELVLDLAAFSEIDGGIVQRRSYLRLLQICELALLPPDADDRINGIVKHAMPTHLLSFPVNEGVLPALVQNGTSPSPAPCSSAFICLLRTVPIGISAAELEAMVQAGMRTHPRLGRHALLNLETTQLSVYTTCTQEVLRVELLDVTNVFVTGKFLVVIERRLAPPSSGFWAITSHRCHVIKCKHPSIAKGFLAYTRVQMNDVFGAIRQSAAIPGDGSERSNAPPEAATEDFVPGQYEEVDIGRPLPYAERSGQGTMGGMPGQGYASEDTYQQPNAVDMCEAETYDEPRSTRGDARTSWLLQAVISGASDDSDEENSGGDAGITPLPQPMEASSTNGRRSYRNIHDQELQLNMDDMPTDERQALQNKMAGDQYEEVLPEPPSTFKGTVRVKADAPRPSVALAGAAAQTHVATEYDDVLPALVLPTATHHSAQSSQPRTDQYDDVLPALAPPSPSRADARPVILEATPSRGYSHLHFNDRRPTAFRSEDLDDMRKRALNPVRKVSRYNHLEHRAMWLHGTISRREAEQRLVAAGIQDGLFLLRESQTQQSAWALSLVIGNQIIHHLLRKGSDHERPEPDTPFTIDGTPLPLGVNNLPVTSLEEIVLLFRQGTHGLIRVPLQTACPPPTRDAEC